MPYTLVIVDMQSTFSAATKPNTVVAVTREVLAAMKAEAAIIFLEFADCGPTHTALYDLTRGYKKKATVTKPHDDGSKQVAAALKRRKFYSRRLRVCGVNTDCCVRATINGLLKKTKAQIEVVKDACATGHYSKDAVEKKYDWDDYINHKNLKLV